MPDTEFALVSGAYASARAAAIRSQQVNHAGFRAFSVQFGRLLSRLDGADDPYWLPLLRHMRRLRFELAATPLAFNAPELALAHTQAAIEAQYAGCSILYPMLAPAVHAVLAAAREVLSSGDAPLLQRLAAVAEEMPLTNSAIVLCEARLLKVVEQALRRHPVLRHCTLIGAAQLRSLRCYSRLLCVGSARWFPEHVTAAPRASRMDFVHFKWTPGPRTSPPLFSIPGPNITGPAIAADTNNREREIVVVGGASPQEDLELDSFGLDEFSPPSDSFLSELLQRAKSASALGGQQQDLLRVLLVGLEGGRAVFLEAEDGTTVLVLDLVERGKNRVRRVPAADIEEGVFVLLRAGGGGDYVVPVADAVLGRQAAECRRVQRDWKTRLRSEVAKHGLFETSIALLDRGAVRADEGNVRRWIWDRSIRPRDFADFLAIMRLVGLEPEASSYWRTMALIDGAHIRAGQLIRKMLIGEVMKSDLAEVERLGTMEFDLPGTGTGQMVACRVLRVATELVAINASNVGRLFTPEEMLWQS